MSGSGGPAPEGLDGRGDGWAGAFLGVSSGADTLCFLQGTVVGCGFFWEGNFLESNGNIVS